MGSAWHVTVPAGEIAVRTAVVFASIYFLLRLMGRRVIGQMTAVDLLLILLVANAVQNAMVGSDTSLTGGLVSAVVLFVLTFLFDYAAVRIPWLRARLQGDPVLLVREGEILSRNLVHSLATQEDIEQAMREQGMDDLAQVKAAFLERDGTISIVREESHIHRSRHRARALKL